MKAIEGELLAPQTNEYGRADQAAAWSLLAKLYLNAEVYLGESQYSECLEYCNKIINASYSLDPEYHNLFLADNNITTNEIIFPVTFDGSSTRTWGGMTFIIHAGVGGDMIPGDFGIDSGWGGTRTTKSLVNMFATEEATTVDVVAANFIEPNYPIIYVPGEYQNWDPTNTETVLWSRASDQRFEGFFNFRSATEIQFTPQPNFNSVFGDNEGDGSLDPNGANIVIPERGFYKIAVDANNFTYSVDPVSFGIIGDAINADTVDLTYNAAEEFWEYTGNLNAGSFEFATKGGGPVFGDSGNAILEENGSTISIPEAGNYTVRLFVNRPDMTFSIARPSSDSRAIFFTEGQSLDILDISQFQEGYAVVKFQNKTSNGENGSDLTFPDTDFPMFRLADIYLMYAEAVLRGGSGGDRGTALDLVNQVRARAFRDPSGGIADGELSLDFLLDERARELYWECHRRTDLVRFGQFSDGDYRWPWKGGEPDGIPVDSKFDRFPIPSSDIGANPNLVQNPGY